MSIINRAKGIIVAPAAELQLIKSEKSSMTALLTGYVLPLAFITAAASFIGHGIIGSTILGVRFGGTISYGIYSALIVLIQTVISFYITSYVVDALAPNFQSEKDLNRSAQLVAYSCTPSLVGGFLAVVPALATIGALFGLYSFYLIFIGLPVLKETPEDKRIGYIVVAILLLLVIYAVIGMILNSIAGSLFGFNTFRSYR